MAENEVLATLTEEEVNNMRLLQTEIDSIKELQNELVDRLTKVRLAANRYSDEIVAKYNIGGSKWNLDVRTRQITAGWK